MDPILVALAHAGLVAMALVASGFVATGALVVCARLLRKGRFLSGLTGATAMLGSLFVGLFAVPVFMLGVTVAKDGGIDFLWRAVQRDTLYVAESFLMTLVLALLTATPMLVSLSLAEQRWTKA